MENPCLDSNNLTVAEHPAHMNKIQELQALLSRMHKAKTGSPKTQSYLHHTIGGTTDTTAISCVDKDERMHAALASTSAASIISTACEKPEMIPSLLPTPSMSTGSFISSFILKEKIKHKAKLESQENTQKILTLHEERQARLKRHQLLVEEHVPATLDQFINKHRLAVIGHDTRAPTHSAYDGGVAGILHIDDSLLLDWYRALVNHLETGQGRTKYQEIMYPQRVRFFMDFDMKLTHGHPMESAFMHRIIQCIQGVMRDFFPRSLREVIICYAYDSKRKLSAEYPQGYFKHGMHLTWPYVIVTMLHARLMAQAIQDRLESVFGCDEVASRTSLTLVSQMVDLQPYELKKGLRMVYQSKAETCPHCQYKRKGGASSSGMNEAVNNIGCPTCDSSGKIEAGRVYEPWMVVNEDGSENPDLLHICRTQALYTFIHTAIRVPLNTPIRADFQEPSWIRPIEADREELAPCFVDFVVDGPIQASHSPLFMVNCAIGMQTPIFYLEQAKVGGASDRVVECQKTGLSCIKIVDNLKAVRAQRKKIESQQIRKVGPILGKSNLLAQDPTVLNVWQSARKKHDLVGIGLSAEQFQLLQRTIQGLHREWSQILLGMCVQTADDGNPRSKRIFITPTVSGAARFCMNKGQHHTQAIIWFLINDKGDIFQKCKSLKPVPRINQVFCSACRIPVGRLPLELSKCLVNWPPPDSSMYEESTHKHIAKERLSEHENSILTEKVNAKMQVWEAFRQREKDMYPDLYAEQYRKRRKEVVLQILKLLEEERKEAVLVRNGRMLEGEDVDMEQHDADEAIDAEDGAKNHDGKTKRKSNSKILVKTSKRAKPISFVDEEEEEEEEDDDIEISEDE